jgi:FKBP-type peptidyl-prolyl cis-trans isomerase FkpA
MTPGLPITAQSVAPPTDLTPSVRGYVRSPARLWVQPFGVILPEAIAPVLGVRRDSLRSTPRGVLYDDMTRGTGDLVQAGDSVAVHFIGYLADGTVVTRSREDPFQVRLGSGRVIAGWEEALPGMRVGGTRQVIIPAVLGYGAKGSGAIPPNATLVFDLQVVERRP